MIRYIGLHPRLRKPLSKNETEALRRLRPRYPSSACANSPNTQRSPQRDSGMYLRNGHPSRELTIAVSFESKVVLHEGERVISAPKIHKLNQSDEVRGVVAYALPKIPNAAKKKPVIAGSLRDNLQPLVLYNRSTHQPAVQFPIAPKIIGMAANRLASKPLSPYRFNN